MFVTEGVGLCRRGGGPIEVIRPVDRVIFKADEEHWLGAVGRLQHAFDPIFTSTSWTV